MTYSEHELEFTFAKNEIISVNVRKTEGDVFIAIVLRCFMEYINIYTLFLQRCLLKTLEKYVKTLKTLKT